MSMPPATPTLKLVGEPGSDFITDMRYDYYGRRLATTSAEGVVRIRDMDENGEWCLQEGCELKATHAVTVWKVDWAHPDFGQLLATCSQDRIVKIWEEHAEAATGDDRGGLPRGPRWLCVASLSESRYGVCDVKFAPRHLGLRIAAASEDGHARFYTATDPSYVGAWHQEPSFVPCGGFSGVTCVSWCESPFESPLIAVGTMSGLVQIWSNDGSKDELGSWRKVLDLPGHDSRAVSCVDWAADMGRSFHRIASCGADGQLQVHQVTSKANLEGEEWRHDQTHQLQDGRKGETKGSAWQAQWNMTGTSLITADGSCVRIWSTEYDGSWSCVDTLHEAGVDRRQPSALEAAAASAAPPPPTVGVIEEG